MGLDSWALVGVWDPGFSASQIDCTVDHGGWLFEVFLEILPNLLHPMDVTVGQAFPISLLQTHN